ncbi:MAG TPA: hypothetical protein VH914_08465 [Acidimicrobiia bacterium]|nr:hypothetical protein [Acidimicrobiia bacterium]
MQRTEPRPLPFSRPRAGFYGLLTVLLLTALVLVMLAHQALA